MGALALAKKALFWILLVFLGMPLAILLLLSVLFPKEMNAVFTLQSAGMVKESAVAITGRLGVSFLAGPLGIILIILSIVSLFIRGSDLRNITVWIQGGEHAEGEKRTTLLLWQIVGLPVNCVLSLVGDLITMNIVHMPLGIIECWRAAVEALTELLTGRRSGYL